MWWSRRPRPPREGDGADSVEDGPVVEAVVGADVEVGRRCQQRGSGRGSDRGRPQRGRPSLDGTSQRQESVRERGEDQGLRLGRGAQLGVERRCWTCPLGLEPKTASSSLDDEAADLIRLARAGKRLEERRLEPPSETTAEEAEPEPVVETPPQVESRLIGVPIGVTPTMFAERVGAQR